MSPQDPQSAALVAHIISQVESNVEFLASQNIISHADASTILSKLPNTANNNASVDQLTSRVNSLGVRAPTSRPVPSAPGPNQARALWAYNEDGQDSDLSFSAGDIIEIVEETNADWWMGRLNGKQALFPSSYVERVQPAPPLAAGAAASGTRAAYKPFGAAYHGMNAPPAPGQGVNSVGLQQADGQEQKKSKYGKFGNTMAHSAAGGVGFGAGAAVGGGLIRAIF